MRFLRSPNESLSTWSQFGFCQDATGQRSSAPNSTRPITPIPAPDAGKPRYRVKSLNEPNSGAWLRSITFAFLLQRRLHDLCHIHTAHCTPKIFKLRHREWAKSRAESGNTVCIIRAIGTAHHHAKLSRWEPVPIINVLPRLFTTLCTRLLTEVSIRTTPAASPSYSSSHVG